MKYKFYLSLLVFNINAVAQQGPTNNNPGVLFNGSGAGNFWSRAGNTQINGTNNIFGTLFNSPIYTETNSLIRQVLNGSRTAVIGGFPAINTDGYMGIGPNTGNIWSNTGPYTRLHLNNDVAPTFGYRPWMQNGVMMTGNADLMYIGQKFNSPDKSDAVIGWSNDGSSQYGPDNLRFIFTDGDANSGIQNNGPGDLGGIDDDGRELMRMIPNGNIGIGPRFNNTWQPQSTLHQHQENFASSWMQITNQSMTVAGGQSGPTLVSPNNGLRFGILGDAQQNRNGNAFIYNQENKHLIFSTNHVSPTNITATQERMRITHIGAPTTLAGGGYGIYNPANLGNDVTRIAISHNPANPVTRPLSLLHLGYNTGAVAITPGTDGWRPWMDIGIFTTNGTDNVYLGLKDEAGILGDRQDAVLSWGDNQVSGLPPGNGPDNFRFIFTSTTAGSGGGTPPATGADGLEGMRLTPTPNTGVFTGVGGAPVVNAYTAGQNAGNTMEVNSWGSAVTPGGSSGLRFTDLNTTSPTLANPGPGVLAVNAAGDVIYVPANAGTNFGNVCGATQNPLTTNWEVPMGGNNYIFSGNTLTGDRVGIGTNCTPVAKLQVENTTGFGGAAIAGAFRNTGVNNNSVGYVGVVGISNVTGTSLLANVGGQFNATGAAINNIGTGATATGGNNAFGVNGTASNGNVWSVAGKFDVINSTSPQNYGINSNLVGGTNASSTNYGASFYNANAGVSNIGVQGVAFNATNNYAIYGSVSSSSGTNPPSGPNYAGYFNGDVVRTGTDNFTSDLNLKQHIDTITDATGIIAQLKPRSFDYQQSNYPSMNLPSGKQYGLIAQDVQLVLPELVNNNVHPAVLDSAGNIVIPAVNFLSLEYQQLIGIMLKGMQEQQHKIDSLVNKTTKQDSINNAVQSQIAALASQINGCCSNANARTGNSPAAINQQDVELSDKDAIVLDQNVPNPFAEQTTITYNVPESVGKAQLIFYNSAGQIIQTVDIKTRGKGKVNVFANDLSSGLYHYTLVADGKVVDSKKMVRE